MIDNFIYVLWVFSQYQEAQKTLFLSSAENEDHLEGHAPSAHSPLPLAANGAN